MTLTPVRFQFLHKKGQMENKKGILSIWNEFILATGRGHLMGQNLLSPLGSVLAGGTPSKEKRWYGVCFLVPGQVALWKEASTIITADFPWLRVDQNLNSWRRLFLVFHKAWSYSLHLITFRLAKGSTIDNKRRRGGAVGHDALMCQKLWRNVLEYVELWNPQVTELNTNPLSKGSTLGRLRSWRLISSPHQQCLVAAWRGSGSW